MKKLLLAVFLSLGAWQIAAASYIHVKAFVAQQLIASSWKQVRGGGVARRPWPWADMRPVARLTVPARLNTGMTTERSGMISAQ